MSQEEIKAAIINDLVAYAKQKLTADLFDQVSPFLAQYFGQVDPEDLQARAISDLYGAAMSHWQLMRRRTTSQPTLRVYNPRLDEHAWQANHTIIEIVNDDMPFLVDSAAMEVNRQGLTLHLIVHPVMRIKRDEAGNILAVLPRDEEAPGSRLESMIHIEMDRQTDPGKLNEIEASLLRVLADVRVSVEDWDEMQAACGRIIEAAGKAPLQPAEIKEGKEFLEWIADNHFTFLGYREYELSEQGDELMLRIVPNSGLGILREESQGDGVSANFSALPPEARRLIDGPHLVFLTKANSRSTVHRPGYLDYIGVKRFDESGKVIGEARFLGLFTSNVYSAVPSDIPLLRRKVRHVLRQAGFLPKSHLEKTLLAIFESYPRDELFQMEEDEMLETAMGILRLQERQRTRLFVRRDVFGRFYSCLVFVPRDKFNTELRLRIQQVLLEAFHGVSAEFQPFLTESVLARIHITIRTTPGTVVDYDIKQLEARIVAVTRRWQDDLADALAERFGEERGNQYLAMFSSAFPAGYREEYTARAAVLDIEMIARLSDAASLGMNLYRPVEAPPGYLRFKLFHRGSPVTLSESLPMLEHLGVKVMDERPYRVGKVIEQGGGAMAEPVWIHDIGLKAAGSVDLEIDEIKPLFQELFARAWRGEVENDDFNRLVMVARLSWRQIVILRAYAKYFRQIGFTFSQSYLEQTLAAYPEIARKLVNLFETRFDPAQFRETPSDRIAAVERRAAALRADLEHVANLDQDRILRQYVDTILATLRTNYFQGDASGAPKTYVSFKFDPKQVPGLPQPKPMFEIFVYSPRMEGVHLRGGKVARGGLRWSDRREDFRTEVLGLVKAQQVKNTVIVPVGSKGGFVVKNPPPASDRDAYLKEGIECYKTLLRGMLDVTDNLVDGNVVPPVDVVRHDPDDPYLVVAADKGTATFSDIANGVSADYGFWLGDAFASGGSVGYDHKKMGITARGAWESVKRHFREMGHDTQTQDFTVVGVGDLSGDVFGNGMLLSKHIRLLAAFDHRHIFLDPSPDAATSYQERVRMFNLPRSSWDDYDKSLISQGGGIFPLSAKTIPISPEVKAVLGIEADQMTPNELKTAILKAPVDLLYNGGIGTYIKASWETHAQVGDRSNDAIRVDGRDLRCKVVAEGGNLGCTQLGRVEAAMQGVKLYTDAIDNSAGVDCSDHEVNIKILLNGLVAAGDMTMKQRNQLLADMTDEVGQLVLQDNYYQTQCLSVTTRRGVQLLEGQARLIRSLESSGLLNRKIEFLPSEDQISERKQAKQGLTAPENAVLLAYSKMALFDALVASDLPEDPAFLATLVAYFPRPLQEHYLEPMQRHPLKREIIATYVTNTMLNRVGATFVHRIQEETGQSAADIVRAFTLTRESFELDHLWSAIDALDNKAPDIAQGQMLIDVARFAQRATLWFLRHKQPSHDIAALIQHYQPGIASLKSALGNLLGGSERAEWRRKADGWIASSVPQDVADLVAGLELLLPGLDLVDVAETAGAKIETAAAVYYALDGRLNHGWLRSQIVALPTDTHWQALARASLRDDLAWRQRALTLAVLKLSPNESSVEAMLARWEQENQSPLARARRVMSDMQALGQADLAMLSVAMRELRNMI